MVRSPVVVGGEERAATSQGQLLDDGVGDGRAVEGGRAAAQFVQQHQRVHRGVLLWTQFRP